MSEQDRTYDLPPVAYAEFSGYERPFPALPPPVQVAADVAQLAPEDLDDDLRPCPWPHGPNLDSVRAMTIERWRNSDHPELDGYQASCPGCFAAGPVGNTPQQAAELWQAVCLLAVQAPRPGSGPVFRLVADEIEAQDERWGWPKPISTDLDPDLRDLGEILERCARRIQARSGPGCWPAIFAEEGGEALTERDGKKRAVELIQVAAVAMGWAQALIEQLEEAKTPGKARVAQMEGGES